MYVCMYRKKREREREKEREKRAMIYMKANARDGQCHMRLYTPCPRRCPPQIGACAVPGLKSSCQLKFVPCVQESVI